jgi:hypothetical protein
LFLAPHPAAQALVRIAPGSDERSQAVVDHESIRRNEDSSAY